MPRAPCGVSVLSPHAVASTWVNKEVAYWLAHRGSNDLLFVVARCSLTWDDDAGRFDPDRSDAALPVLTQPGVLPTEPLYVDVSDDAPWNPPQRCSGRWSPIWPPPSTANPNTNWPARICASNTGFDACDALR